MSIRRVERPAAGVHRVEITLGERYVACYLLVGQDRTVIIDTGTASQGPTELVGYLDEAGIDRERVEMVIATHADFDHFGGASTLLSRLPRAQFVCHPADAKLIGDVDALVRDRYDEFGPEHGVGLDATMEQLIRAQVDPVTPDSHVVAGQRIELGDGWTVVIMHLPGHSDGHLAVHDPRSSSVVLGDAIMGRGLLTAEGQPLYPPTYRRVRDQAASISTLQALHCDVLLTAHYPVMSGAAAQAFVAESADFADALGQAILEMLGTRGPTNLRSMIGVLAPRLGTWPEDSWSDLAFPLVGHLEDFEERDLVLRIHDLGSPPEWVLHRL